MFSKLWKVDYDDDDEDDDDNDDNCSISRTNVLCYERKFAFKIRICAALTCHLELLNSCTKT